MNSVRGRRAIGLLTVVITVLTGALGTAALVAAQDPPPPPSVAPSTAPASVGTDAPDVQQDSRPPGRSPRTLRTLVLTVVAALVLGAGTAVVLLVVVPALTARGSGSAPREGPLGRRRRATRGPR